ncbi:GtrA family protein [Lysobacter niastensis]|uniref:GtrA family protein n=1 Tax=Lysobacter niastensis TaxID=380629 RepID=A0ABS0B568_9GAMM|nr:GtrA family protein [Lysobacter niastensis]MBF6023938.1 GtrA family protein [Lysobacter niastensis]
MRRLLHQGSRYFAVGVLQFLLDWLMFVVLSAAGMPVEPANVLGRISGAALGFWLNGRFTFTGDDNALGRRQFARFAVMWVGTTFFGTWAVAHVEQVLGLRWTWLAKPVIDLALSAVGFVLSRHWIYRR